MARNSAWRGSLATWKHRIDGWIGSAGGDDLLNVDIFFDQRPVYGELQLGAELFDHAYAVAGRNPPFAKLMGEKLFSGQSPFTLLGGVRTTEGRIDLKLHGLFPIVTAARSLAIRHDIRRRSTSDRLQGLIERGLGNAGEIAGLIAAHRVFVALMLDQQSVDLETGIAVSNKVATGSLSHASLAALKSALKAVQTVPDMVRALTFG